MLHLFLLLRATSLLRHGDIKPNPGPTSPSPSSCSGSCASLQTLKTLKTEVSTAPTAHASKTQLPNSISGGPSHESDRGERKDSSRCASQRNNQLVLQLTNSRSILPKVPEIRHEVYAGRRPDVIAVTESWLKDSVPDDALSLPGYDIHRRDRMIRRGGGVLLWTSSALKCVRRFDLQEWQEDLWVEISSASCRPLVLACIYRPPDSSMKEFCDALETSLSRVSLNKCDVLVVGNFNATSPRWLASDSFIIAAALCSSRPLFSLVFASWCHLPRISIRMAR